MRTAPLLLGTVLVLAVAAYATRERTGLDRYLPRDAQTALATAPPAAPAPAFVMPVPVVAVVKRSVPITLDYAARTEAIRAVTLQAKVSAYVAAQVVPDGSDVKAGDLLYKLDPRDFQVALDQANAQIERDNASLTYQQSSYERGDALSKSGYIAKDSFDQRASSMQQAAASLTADKALVRAAQLNLAYTEIRAPFPGRLGRDQAAVGTLVSPGTTVLNTLVQLDPLYVTFNPSEGDLAAIDAVHRQKAVTVEVSVPDAATPAHKGELTFLDNGIDRSTGTVTARATLANADKSLLPGQYVHVRVHLRDQADTLLVPQVAVGSSQLGKFVYTVGSKGTVELCPVVLGPIEGSLVAVTGALKEGDRVITGNLQKIGPGMPVAPMPDQSASATP